MKQILLAALLFSTVILTAQDLHFSQTTLAPLHQNPALAGVFEGDYRAGANLRRQWKTVPVPYQTVSFFADGKLLDLGKTRLGGGLVFDSDQAGDGALSWSEMQLAGSIGRVLSQKSMLSAGFSVGLAQRTFDISGLKFKNQFQDGQFLASNDPLESGFNRSTGSILDMAAGLNFHFKNPKNRTWLDAGCGVFHLNGPTVSFKNEKPSQLDLRFNFHGNVVIEAGKKRDFLLFVNYQAQHPYKETLASIGVRKWFKSNDETAISYLIGARFGDAIVPSVRLEWKSWLVGLSYDWNFSPFAEATFGKAGPELAVQWRMVKVPPVKTFKACPIF